MAYYVHSVTNNLPISDNQLKRFQEETINDKNLQIVKHYTMNGWPNKDDIDNYVKPYYNIREEISYHNGLLLKDTRIVLPLSLRSEIKSLLHEEHQGIERTKLRARSSFYWPNINKEIADLYHIVSPV